MTRIFHPLLALILSATDKELARYVQFLKEESKILRARVPAQIHTRSGERERLLKHVKALGRTVEELITIVTPATFYRWMRDENGKPKAKKPKGGQRKPREIRELLGSQMILRNVFQTDGHDDVSRAVDVRFPCPAPSADCLWISLLHGLRSQSPHAQSTSCPH